MSRIGKQPVLIPQDVNVKIDGCEVTAEGPKGTLSYHFRPEIKITLEEGKVLVAPKRVNR